LTEKGEERPTAKNKKSTVILAEPEVVKKAKKKSSKMCEKTNSNLKTGKSYEDFSPILDGYADLLDHLNPEESEVDKVVKFILDKNILVRNVNVQLSHISVARSRNFYQSIKGLSSMKVGRYTKGKFGEDACLLKRWDELVRDVPIKDPQNFITELSHIQPIEKKHKGLKRNVVGCYLGQDLDDVRHAADVFRRIRILLCPPIYGKFRKEEDEIILREVEKLGPGLKTWNQIGVLLGRTRIQSISRRYQLITAKKPMAFGRWTLSENKILLENLFGGKKGAGVDEIKSVRFNDIVLDLVADKLSRLKVNVWLHWNKHLKPVLLSYHYGTLHKLWRSDFLKYLVEKKVTGSQSMNYSEIATLFPEQTPDSLLSVLDVFSQKHEIEEQPLYQIIQKYLPTYRDLQGSDRMTNFREEIVRIYDEVRNRS
jgi:hypothetical protein